MACTIYLYQIFTKAQAFIQFGGPFGYVTLVEPLHCRRGWGEGGSGGHRISLGYLGRMSFLLTYHEFLEGVPGFVALSDEFYT